MTEWSYDFCVSNGEITVMSNGCLDSEANKISPDPSLSHLYLGRRGIIGAPGAPVSQVNEANDIEVSEQAVREELERLLQTPIFAQSDRLGRFLRFTVEHAIGGTQDLLKEYLIGAEVYDRKPPYHPSQDSIVRTEARRLKQAEGVLRKGRARATLSSSTFGLAVTSPYFVGEETSDSPSLTPAAGENGLFMPGSGSPIAVIPFVDMSGSPLPEPPVPRESRTS